MNFERYAAAGNELIKQLMDELRTDDRDRAGRVLRAVLHALRQRLPADESLQLMAQLPLVVKGLYVDGWRLSDVPDKSLKTAEDFFQEMADQDGSTGARDFPNDIQARKSAQAVFRTLERYVSEGEVKDVLHNLPRPIAEIWEQA